MGTWYCLCVLWMTWYAPQICLAGLLTIVASEQSRPADSVMNKCHAKHGCFKASNSAGKHVKISGEQIGTLASQTYWKPNKHTGYL